MPVIGSFDERGNLSYSDEQITVISRLFRDIEDTRMTVREREEDYYSTAAAATAAFTPSISSISRKLAADKK